MVDDEQFLADAVTMGLVHAGFLVRQAADRRFTLELVGSFRPDLVVLDVMLPDMDGVRSAPGCDRPAMMSRFCS